MGKKESEKVKKLYAFVLDKIKSIKPIDSVTFFAIVIGHFDFGVFQCLVIALYLVYKILSILSDKSNFCNKVAFS